MSSIPNKGRVLLLKERPETKITPSTFAMDEFSIPSPLPSDTFLVKVTTLALEPSMRISMKTPKFKGYRPPTPLDSKVWAFGIGTVVASNSKDYEVGQLVQGNFGTTEHCLVDLKNDELFKSSPPRKLGSKEQIGFDPRESLSTLSAPGFAAYIGLFEVGKWERNGKQTLLVSGAAGATGSLVIQMAKITAPESRVIGIAGGKEKCEYVKTVGADSVLDYRSSSFEEDLKRECHDSVDLYFDNVGGKILDLSITQIKMFGRISLCGQISDYQSAEPYGVKNLSLVLTQSITMQGFICLPEFWPEALKKGFVEMSQWLSEGKLESQFYLHQPSGLENLPGALQGLFESKNTGKMLIDL